MAAAEQIAELNPGGRYIPPRRPARGYPFEVTNGQFDFQVHLVTPSNREPLRDRVEPFESAFGYSSRRLVSEKVKKFVRDGAEVVFARTKDDNPRDVAVVTQEVVDVQVEGKDLRALYIGIRVVDDDFQKGGLGKDLAKEGAMRHHVDAITGGTRTWMIVRMYQELGINGPISPFDLPENEFLPPDDLDLISQVLDGHDRTILNRMDRLTGVTPRYYPQATTDKELKRMIPPADNLKAQAVRRRMTQLNGDPIAGDRFSYVTYTKPEALLELRRSGYFQLKPTEVSLRPPATAVLESAAAQAVTPRRWFILGVPFPFLQGRRIKASA